MKMAPGRVTRLRTATLLLLVVAASGANAGQSEGDDPGQEDEYAVVSRELPYGNM